MQELASVEGRPMPLQEQVAVRSTVAGFAGAATGAVRALLGFVLIAMVVLNVANAVGRYAFGAVLIGADELLVFGMVWMVMLGMLLVTADRCHIALDIFAARSGPRTRIVLCLITHAVIALGCGYAALQSFHFVARIAALGQTSMGLGIPMLIPHSALIVGFGGTAVIAVLLFVSELARLITGAGRKGGDRP
jgi:TRAP-type C4-dicarboxylate transport system permease small subunit